MTQEYPLVTIVITTFNSAKHIEETIQSALDQHYPNIQIVLIDDGSSDSTVEIAEHFLPEIKIIEQQNSGGPSRPRNIGLRIAKGTYISFLDGDDLLVPEKIKRQVQVLELHPEAAMCIGDYKNFKDEVIAKGHFSTCPRLMQKFNEPEKGSTLILPKGTANEILIEENFTITVSGMYRTALIKEQGGFSEKLKACEDYHLNYLMAMNHSIVVLNEFVFKRRIHNSNLSSHDSLMLNYYIKSRIMLMQQEKCFNRAIKLRSRARRHFRSFVKKAVRNLEYRQIFQVILWTKVLYLQSIPKTNRSMNATD